MKTISLVATLLVVAACGADGPPITPTYSSSVTVGTSGVSASTGVSVSSGPVSVGVGF